jgi:hypothetical protein
MFNLTDTERDGNMQEKICLVWVTMFFYSGNNMSLTYVAVSSFINSDTELILYSFRSISTVFN